MSKKQPRFTVIREYKKLFTTEDLLRNIIRRHLQKTDKKEEKNANHKCDF